MKFPSIDKYIDESDELLLSDENSKEGINIPEVISESGSGIANTIKMRRHVIPRMIGCLKQANISAKSITKNPKLGKVTISTGELQNLEEYIKSLGICDIGYTKVDREMIFKNRSILYENTIVLTMEMKKDSISTAPSSTAIKEIFRTYHELGIAVNKISEFLREHGFNAMAAPAIGGEVNYVPLAEKAGLGVIGKHGLLISDKDYGPSLRIAAVFTDIENLPFAQVNTHMWVKDFCAKCNRCVKACPGKAIYDYPTNNGECIDYRKCAIPFANDYGCTLCIKNCTFYNTKYSRIKSVFTKA